LTIAAPEISAGLALIEAFAVVGPWIVRVPLVIAIVAVGLYCPGPMMIVLGPPAVLAAATAASNPASVVTVVVVAIALAEKANVPAAQAAVAIAHARRRGDRLFFLMNSPR
jgi:hypothetical protein